MKIIKRGELPELKTYETTCNSCRTVFEYFKQEAKAQFDRNEHYLTIDCPVCKRTVSVDLQNNN